jgi:hypothetical protein
MTIGFMDVYGKLSLFHGGYPPTHNWEAQPVSGSPSVTSYLEDLDWKWPTVSGLSGLSDLHHIKYLVGGAITILKNMSSSMGRMTSHI